MDIAAGKALCKFTLMTANTKLGGAVLGPESQKSLQWFAGTLEINLVNP